MAADNIAKNNYMNGCTCKEQTITITKRPVDWAIWSNNDVIGFIGITEGDTMPDTIMIQGQTYIKER